MLEMSSWPSASELRLPPNVTTCLVGIECDDRGRAAVGLCQSASQNCLRIQVDPKALKFTVESQEYAIDDYSPLIDILSNGRLIVDATTVGFCELFLCIKAAKELKSSNLCILYVEPDNYKSKRSRGVIHRRDFELSRRSDQFVGVPGAVIMMARPANIKTVIVMGYESGRLQQILEQFPELCGRCNIMLGVPAFQAGWEMNAYANVVGEIESKRLPAVLFAGAANPLRAYHELLRVYESKGPLERLLVVPIGTKPHGIGAALFAVTHEGVGLMYDNPERKDGRSEEVGACHLYQFQF